MKQTRLKAKDFNKELEQAAYTISFSKKDAVERIDDKENDLVIISINKTPAFFYYENRLLPTIKFLHSQKEKLLKSITVDMGAIKFLVSGADIMRPGIVEIDQDIIQNDVIAVIDQKNKMIISIGISMFDASEMNIQEKGKSVKNMHYVGDNIWKF
jgi:PUA-domain protein